MLSILSNDSAASTYPEVMLAPMSDTVVGSQTGTTAKLKVRPVPVPHALLEKIHPDPPNSPPTDTLELTGPSLRGHHLNHPLQNPALRAVLRPHRHSLPGPREGAWAAQALQAELSVKRSLQMDENTEKENRYVTVTSVTKISLVLAGGVYDWMISEINVDVHMALEVNKL